MQKIVILGASSAIARAFARLMAGQNAELLLVGRDKNRLDSDAIDYKIRGAKSAQVIDFDFKNIDQYDNLIGEIQNKMPLIDVVLIAFGTLPDQKICETDAKVFTDQFLINGLSPMILSEKIMPLFENSGKGCLAVISSVAGDRGRKANYAYGAAKSALSTYLSGLRNRFGSTNIHIMTIKPGFVDTPMTRGFVKKGSLWAQPEQVAFDISNAINKKKNIVYTRWFWRYIMLIIKAIPEFLFKRMSI